MGCVVREGSDVGWVSGAGPERDGLIRKGFGNGERTVEEEQEIGKAV